MKDEKVPQYVILGNARIHHAIKAQEWLDNVNSTASVAHQLFFLPPYSPFLNPVEECFSKMKYFVKRQPLTKKKNLTSCIEEAGNKITGKDCDRWISHSLSFFPRCLAKEKECKYDKINLFFFPFSALLKKRRHTVFRVLKIQKLFVHE